MAGRSPRRTANAAPTRTPRTGRPATPTPPPTDAATNRARLLASAGRGFRAHGYAGLGIDGLAKAAGLTSGAFYAQFTGKADAFGEALTTGLRELAAGIEHVRATRGARWREGLVDFYLTVRRQCAPGEACALQAMIGDVPRLGVEAQRIFDAELGEIVARMTAGTAPAATAAERRRSLALLALLSGAVSMARATDDPALGDEIVAAARWLAARAE